MQPVKLVIPGEYWDTQVYAGRLYLFGIDSSVTTLDWDKLVDEWTVSADLKLAMSCAFRRSDYLYGNSLHALFHDPEVKQLITSKFTRLANKQLVASRDRLNKALVSVQDSPFPFPHTDSRIYSRRFYTCSQEGVFDAGCTHNLTYGISTRPGKTWDAPVLGMAAYSNTLAMAAGDEGLFEHRLRDTSWEYGETLKNGSRDPKQLAGNHSSDCEWAYYSVFASSHVGDGYLAEFRTHEEPDGDGQSLFSSSVTGGAPKRLVREFNGVVAAHDLFQGRGYSWANRDKIYQYANGRVDVMQYRPWTEVWEDRLQSLGSIAIQPWKGDVVSAGVAVFGTVIECDNALVVLLSGGKSLTLRGEPVRWRVFPRSRHYENQLHVLYDDRLEVLSFNHDYFVDQELKQSGIQPYLR